MWYREDYYKFTYSFLPHTVFNYGRLLNYRMLRDEELFIESLRKTRSIMELEAAYIGITYDRMTTLDILHMRFEEAGRVKFYTFFVKVLLTQITTIMGAILNEINLHLLRKYQSY